MTCPGIRCGFVVVRYGSPASGLVARLVTVLTESRAAAQSIDNFGNALAAGDFNGDGIDDLAVGIPRNQPDARCVRISTARPPDSNSPMLSFSMRPSPANSSTSATAPTSAARSLPATSMATFADLAIGAPLGCDTNLNGPPIRGGSVFVLHGSRGGLLPFVGYRMSQSSFGYDPVEVGDPFGEALAAGDFDADGDDDVAIGVAAEGGDGAIQIVMGSEFGLLFADNAFWAPGALGEVPEVGDLLGDALAGADFDGDGHDDLAIGTPHEDLPDPGNDLC